MRLVEKYRPMTLDDIVGQTDAKQTVRALLKRGIGGRAPSHHRGHGGGEAGEKESRTAHAYG